MFSDHVYKKRGRKHMNHILRIGSRKSVLALRQAEMIAEQLKNKFPGLQTEILTRDTLGDQLLHSPLQAFGGKGAFGPAACDLDRHNKAHRGSFSL